MMSDRETQDIVTEGITVADEMDAYIATLPDSSERTVMVNQVYDYRGLLKRLSETKSAIERHALMTRLATLLDPHGVYRSEYDQSGRGGCSGNHPHSG